MDVVDRGFISFLATIFIIVLVAIGVPVVVSNASAAPSTVELQISNPYKLDVDVELKCDWDGKRYVVHRFVSMPGKKITHITVPGGVRRCELWPKISF